MPDVRFTFPDLVSERPRWRRVGLIVLGVAAGVLAVVAVLPASQPFLSPGVRALASALPVAWLALALATDA